MAKKIYGGSLALAVKSSPDSLPEVCRACFDRLSTEEALQTEGLFRIAPEEQEMGPLIRKFADSKSKDPDLTLSNPHVAGTILKRYLRSLDPPLVPYEYYTKFIDVLKLHPQQSQAKSLAGLIIQLPEPNQVLLTRLAQLWFQVAAHATVNKMNSRNIAVVFGPCIMSCQDPMQMMQFSLKQNDLVQLMIDHCTEVFPSSTFISPSHNAALPLLPKAGSVAPAGQNAKKRAPPPRSSPIDDTSSSNANTANAAGQRAPFRHKPPPRAQSQNSPGPSEANAAAAAVRAPPPPRNSAGAPRPPPPKRDANSANATPVQKVDSLVGRLNDSARIDSELAVPAVLPQSQSFSGTTGQKNGADSSQTAAMAPLPLSQSFSVAQASVGDKERPNLTTEEKENIVNRLSNRPLTESRKERQEALRLRVAAIKAERGKEKEKEKVEIQEQCDDLNMSPGPPPPPPSSYLTSSPTPTPPPPTSGFANSFHSSSPSSSPSCSPSSSPRKEMTPSSSFKLPLNISPSPSTRQVETISSVSYSQTWSSGLPPKDANSSSSSHAATTAQKDALSHSATIAGKDAVSSLFRRQTPMSVDQLGRLASPSLSASGLQSPQALKEDTDGAASAEGMKLRVMAPNGASSILVQCAPATTVYELLSLVKQKYAARDQLAEATPYFLALSRDGDPLSSRATAQEMVSSQVMYARDKNQNSNIPTLYLQIPKFRAKLDVRTSGVMGKRWRTRQFSVKDVDGRSHLVQLDPKTDQQQECWPVEGSVVREWAPNYHGKGCEAAFSFSEYGHANSLLLRSQSMESRLHLVSALKAMGAQLLRWYCCGWLFWRPCGQDRWRRRFASLTDGLLDLFKDDQELEGREVVSILLERRKTTIALQYGVPDGYICLIETAQGKHELKLENQTNFSRWMSLLCTMCECDLMDTRSCKRFKRGGQLRAGYLRKYSQVNKKNSQSFFFLLRAGEVGQESELLWFVTKPEGIKPVRPKGRIEITDQLAVNATPSTEEGGFSFAMIVGHQGQVHAFIAATAEERKHWMEALMLSSETVRHAFSIKEGSMGLQKKSFFSKGFQDRWFVLLPDRLLWYKTKHEPTHEGEIEIDRQTIISDTDDEANEQTIGLVRFHGGSSAEPRALVLSLKSAEDKRVWFDALRRRISGYIEQILPDQAGADAASGPNANSITNHANTAQAANANSAVQAASALYKPRTSDSMGLKAAGAEEMVPPGLQPPLTQLNAFQDDAEDLTPMLYQNEPVRYSTRDRAELDHPASAAGEKGSERGQDARAGTASSNTEGKDKDKDKDSEAAVRTSFMFAPDIALQATQRGARRRSVSHEMDSKQHLGSDSQNLSPGSLTHAIKPKMQAKRRMPTPKQFTGVKRVHFAPDSPVILAQ